MLVNQKINIVNTSSCNLQEPFVKLEDNGQASILNYQIPQETTYSAKGYVVLNVDSSDFKQELISQNTSPVWTAIEEVRQLDSKGIQQAVLNKNNLIIGYPILEKNLKLEAVRVGTLSNATLLQQVKNKTKSNNIPIKVDQSQLIKNAKYAPVSVLMNARANTIRRILIRQYGVRPSQVRTRLGNFGAPTYRVRAVFQ